MKTKRLIAFFILFAFVFGYSIAQTPTDPDLEYYKEPGIYPTRSYTTQHFNEHVDPFTGRLQLHYVDLFIPGNGGIDITIGRSYTSIDDGVSVQYSPFGVGWTMHFGRIVRRSSVALCATNYTDGRSMPVLELPNGSRQTLFRDDVFFVNSGSFVTTNFWRAECIGSGTGLRVYSPDGRQYEMTQLVGNDPLGQNSWYTTKITDRNGNYLNISYANLGGRIVPQSITSPADGRSVTFSYTGSGMTTQLASISDGVRTWQYQYKAVNGLKFLTSVQPPAGNSWQYTYKEIADGNQGVYSLRSVIYPLGGSITYTYGKTYFVSSPGAVPNTTLTQKVASPGGTWTFAYSPSTGFGVNDRTTVTAPNGTTTYQHVGYNTVGVGDYWKYGLLVEKKIGNLQTETLSWTYKKISDQDNVRPGSTLAADYEARAPLLSSKAIVRDGNTYTTTFSNFDSYSNPQTISEASSGFSKTTTVTYQINPTLWLIRQPRDESTGGFEFKRVIDSKGNVTQETRYGATTKFSYDSQGNVASRTDGRNITTYFGDYYRGIPRVETHPEGIVVRRTVSAAGNVTSETDGKGDTIGYGYDGLNRITSIDYPRAGSADVSVVWGSASMTLTRGTFRQTVNYDGFGRIASVSLADSMSPSQNANITMGYDALGRRTFQSLPNSTAGDTYGYDILDRVTSIKHSDATSRTFTYGSSSVAVLNERGKTHTFSYRAYGNPDQRDLMGITVPVANASISIGRNVIGNVTSVAQGGYTRVYGYNASNFLTSITDPETGTTLFGRDGVGNMTSRQVGSSPTAIYTYDGLNRLTYINYPDPTPDVTKSYWGDGQVRTVSNGEATRYFEYDNNKNLTLERLTVDGKTFDIRHTYGANDGRNGTTFPSGTAVNYGSNGFNRPTKALPFLSSVDFHPNGQLKTLGFANGVTTSIGLNSRQWPQRLSSTRTGVSIADIQYTYDGTGNVTKFEDFVDSANTIPTLSYDDIDRLVLADTTAEARRISYDGVGNILAQTMGASSLTYAYNSASNRLTSISGSRSRSFSYDVYGNVVHNGQVGFEYNHASQMVCAQCSTASEARYGYDGLGMRVKATQGGKTTYFLYGQEGNLLAEQTTGTIGGSDETKEYIYVAGRQVAVKSSIKTVTTTVAPSPSISAPVGKAANVSLTVSGNTPTGTVSFYEGSTLLGTANVSNGTATASISGLALGSHSITAVYSGDANNTSSSTSFELKIIELPDLKWLPAVLNLLLD